MWDIIWHDTVVNFEQYPICFKRAEFPCSQNTQYTIQFLYFFQFAMSISKTQAHMVLCYFCLCSRHYIMTLYWLYTSGEVVYLSLQDKDVCQACPVYLGTVHGRRALRGVSSCEHCRLLRGSTVEEQVGFMERVLGEDTVACRKPFLLNYYKFIN